MIVASRKPLEEIKKGLAAYHNILVVGCGTCVAVCLAGGKKEVGLLASQLRMGFGLEKKQVRISEETLERQCDREFLEMIREQVKEHDALLSLACGAGVQFLAETYPEKPVYPGVNTTFIGVAEAAGLWTERCRACGDCVLAVTGGVCPRTKCTKGLNNGPCGGMMEGKCEVDQDRSCAWVSIYERLAQEGRLSQIEPLLSPTDFRCQTKPGTVTHRAYLRRYHAGSK
jgi:ferredoxin